MDYLKFCHRCRHYEFNFQTGILCGLTHKKPIFETVCKDFILDPERDKKVQEISRVEQSNKIGNKKERSEKEKFDLVDWVILLAVGLFFGSGIGFFVNSILAEIFHYSLKPSEFPLQWLIIGGVAVLFTLGLFYFFRPKKISKEPLEKSITTSKEQCLECQKISSNEPVEVYVGKLVIGKEGADYFEDVTKKDVLICDNCFKKSKREDIIISLIFPSFLWIFFLIDKIFNLNFHDFGESWDAPIVILFARILAWVFDNGIFILPIVTIIAFIIGYKKDPMPELLKKIFDKDNLTILSEEEYHHFKKNHNS